jgi:hypothetical protein
MKRAKSTSTRSGNASSHPSGISLELGNDKPTEWSAPLPACDHHIEEPRSESAGWPRAVISAMVYPPGIAWALPAPATTGVTAAVTSTAPSNAARPVCRL